MRFLLRPVPIDLPPDAELGPRMLACSAMERRFVWAFALGQASGQANATQAARDAGYSEESEGALRVQAHSLMHRDRVLDALEEVGRRHFRSLLVPAVKAAAALIHKPDHSDHAKTVFSVLSRLGLAERTGVDVNVSGEVTVSHTDAALQDLRSLLALGVPREQLVATFGASGLERYEKMLAAAERPRFKTIELDRKEFQEQPVEAPWPDEDKS